MSAQPPLSPPQSLEIALTGRCNLRCRYCFFADEMQALRDRPTADWLTFFGELGRLGVQHLTLTGDFNRANPVDCYRNFLAATLGVA
jgi:MoaA/NifB/PqqE/SkfB family radical SAM enzyme